MKHLGGRVQACRAGPWARGSRCAAQARVVGSAIVVGVRPFSVEGRGRRRTWLGLWLSKCQAQGSCSKRSTGSNELLSSDGLAGMLNRTRQMVQGEHPRRTLGTVCIFAERNDSGNGASGRKHADEACVFVVERRTKHDQGMRLLERKSRKRIPCRSSSCSVVPGMRETGWLVSMVSSCKKRQSPLSFGWFRRGGIGGVERNRYCKENKTTLQ